MKGFSFVWCPPLGGSVTEAAAEPQLKEEKWQEPFLSFSLYGPSGWGLSVFVSMCVCQRVRERKRQSMRQTEKAREREREPLGSNKSGLHWPGGSWRILRGKTGVHSILVQRLWSDTSVILHNTHTDTARAEITQRQNPFPPLVPHYHVAALCFIFGFVLNVKYCCDQIMRANCNAGRFCKQFTIDYSATYCVSLCFPFSL